MHQARLDDARARERAESIDGESVVFHPCDSIPHFELETHCCSRRQSATMHKSCVS